MSNGLSSTDILSILLLVAIMVTAFIGNILVIYATARSVSLRSYTNLLILNLSISDCMITCVNLPLRICYFWGFDLARGPASCKISMAVTIFVFTASNFNLFMITLDRFFGVLFPLRYRKNMSKNKLYSVISLAWTLDAVVTIFPFFARGTKEITEPVNDDFICLFSTVFRPFYVVGLELLTLAIPWTVMVIMYVFILRAALRSARSKMRATTLSSLSEQDANDASHEKKVQELRVTKMILVILSIYSITMVPIGLLDLVNTFAGESLISGLPIKIALFLSYLNPATNPPIYAMSDPKYRSMFWTALTKDFFCKKKSQEDFEPAHIT